MPLHARTGLPLDSLIMHTLRERATEALRALSGDTVSWRSLREWAQDTVHSPARDGRRSGHRTRTGGRGTVRSRSPCPMVR